MAGTRVCVVGSVNLDAVFRVAALPAPGATVLASGCEQHPGGKGANQAVAAARAGASVAFVGALGDDAAAGVLRAHLVANDVGVDAVSTVEGPSGVAVLTVDAAGQNTIVVAPGANAAVRVDTESAVSFGFGFSTPSELPPVGTCVVGPAVCTLAMTVLLPPPAFCTLNCAIDAVFVNCCAISAGVLAVAPLGTLIV